MRKFLGLLVAALLVTGATSAFAQSSKFKAEITFISTGTSFGVTMLKMDGIVPNAGLDQPTDTIVWDGKFGAPARGSSSWLNSDVYVRFNAGIEISTSSVVRFYTNNKSTGTTAYPYHAQLSTTAANAMSALDANRQPLNEAGLPISYMVTASTSITNVGSLDLGTNAAGEFKFGVWAVKDLYHDDYLDASFGVTAEYSTIATSEGIRLGYGDTGAGEPPVWYDFPTDPTYMFFSSIFVDAKANRVYGTDTLTFEVQNP